MLSITAQLAIHAISIAPGPPSAVVAGILVYHQLTVQLLATFLPSNRAFTLPGPTSPPLSGLESA
jgi:hypothetical protein